MIGTVKRQIACLPLPNTQCSHCNSTNNVLGTVYSEMFILKILPFATGKSVTAECSSCKKLYFDYEMTPQMYDRAMYLKQHTKHPWFAYIGYAIIGLALIGSIFADKKPQ